jgi:hypothetical protein
VSDGGLKKIAVVSSSILALEQKENTLRPASKYEVKPFHHVKLDDFEF